MLIAAIFVYTLVVELLKYQLAPFEGFVPELDILGTLRLIFALVGLVDLGFVLVLLMRPGLVQSVGTAFVLAYVSLEAIAIYGLVLFLLGGSRLDFYQFAIPALVGQLLLWTQAGRWDELTTAEQFD
jgi:hypothetical protein